MFSTGHTTLLPQFPLTPRLDGRTTRVAHFDGVGYDTALSSAAETILRGSINYPDIYSDEDWRYSLYVGGVRKQTYEDPTAFPVPTDSARFLARVDLLAFPFVPQWDILEGVDFHPATFGDRIVLTWTDKPTDSDFFAYVIYWDNATGSYLSTPVATLENIDQTSYAISAVTAGTYKCKVLYQDVSGNIGNVGGDNGQETRIDVEPPPPAPTLSLNSLGNIASPGPWAHTFALARSADETDVLFYAYAVNHTPFAGETLFSEMSLQHARTYAQSGAVNLTLPLFAGLWKITATAVTKYGTASLPSTVEFTLLEDGAGGLLYQAGTAPTRCIDLRALPGATGDIVITGSIVSMSPWGFELQRDGSQIDLSGDVGDSYGFTDLGTGLVDTQSYVYRVRPYLTIGSYTVYGEWSGNAEAVSDASPPSGDQIITSVVAYGGA